MRVLDLNFNEIEDVSSLAYLSNQQELLLDGTKVGNFEPLLTNRGLGRSDRVELDDSVLDAGANRVLAARLADRGVDVEFDVLYATPFG